MAEPIQHDGALSSYMQAYEQQKPESRLSLPIITRLPLAVALSSLTGMILGSAHGSNEAAYRFRAENAHRLPTTQAGWYLYHKSKNYHKMLAGVKEGGYMAVRLSIWTLLFVGMEEAVDGARAGLARIRRGDQYNSPISKDFLSTTLAGLGTAGAFSAWNRFPVATAARMARLGLKAGLCYGLLQDAVGFMRGRRLGYVEFIKIHLLGASDGRPEVEAAG